MHVNLLPISLAPRYRGRHHDERIFIHEISDTSLILCRMSGMGSEVEFER